MKPKKQMIYSTIYLTDGAAGSQNLFTVPVGQRMAAMQGPDSRCVTCGNFESAPIQTQEHTNIYQAGTPGESIGDIRLCSVEAKTSDGSNLDAWWEFAVSGRRIAGGPLRDIFGAPMPIPSVEVGRYDSVEFRIGLNGRLSRPKNDPLFVKVEFWGELVPSEVVPDAQKE